MKTGSVKPLGLITRFERVEHRDIVKVTDGSGYLVELLPQGAIAESPQIELALTHPTSGETLVFWVPVSKPVADFYFSPRVKVARTVGKLSEELLDSLNGVEDDHDRVVRACEATPPIKKIQRRSSKKKSAPKRRK